MLSNPVEPLRRQLLQHTHAPTLRILHCQLLEHTHTLPPSQDLTQSAVGTHTPSQDLTVSCCNTHTPSEDPPFQTHVTSSVEVVAWFRTPPWPLVALPHGVKPRPLPTPALHSLLNCNHVLDHCINSVANIQLYKCMKE